MKIISIVNRRMMLLVALVLCTLSMSAQMPRAAEVTSSIEIESNGVGVLTFEIIPGDGWHIYAFDVAKGGPKPMIVNLIGSTGIEVIGKPEASVAPSVQYDSNFDMKVPYWNKPVVVTQRFKVTGKEAVVTGHLQYQGCNGETCAPPKKFKFSYSVN